jgi:ribosomal protein S18 acetylase RimI-like enzyme
MAAIRPTTVKDAPEIARLFKLSREATMPWLPVLHSPEEDLRFFERRVLSDEFQNFVFESDTRIVGMLCLTPDWVDQLYIAPDRLREGIGSRLLTHAMDGVSYRQLWVFKQNVPAQSFYLSHGFVKVEETDGHNNEERCPDIRMEWRAT